MITVNCLNTSGHPLPAYQTPQSAGVDLTANTNAVQEKFLFNASIADGKITIKPGGRCLIPTGLFIALPVGYEAQVRPRSGLALKYGISICNTPGTIDADYRGEIGVILINHGLEDFVVNDGDRIAQLVVARYEQVSFNLVETLDETERGAGGFGHTNV